MAMTCSRVLPYLTLRLGVSSATLHVADPRAVLRAGELRALLLGLAINVAGTHVHDLDADVNYLMGEFDSDKDGSVSRSEFHAALLRCGVHLQPCSWVLLSASIVSKHIPAYTDTETFHTCMD